MKYTLSRRRFLGATLGASALTVLPKNAAAQTRKDRRINPYVRCGRMTAADLRDYYRPS